MSGSLLQDILVQVGLAFAYYAILVLIMRLAGKRLAGQTTTFDLVILITISVVLQTTALREGALNALTFVATVFGAHQLLALACARSTFIRRIVRSRPQPLIQDACVDYEALKSEGLTYEELLAGLRKLGHSSPEGIRSATLEETGHISAIPLEREDPAHPPKEVPPPLPAQGET
ncbi:DUF421 domain-containing protein [Candidatus Nitrospira nitrificans]|uniref:YetF C-terminal domain-containing protein n=1 Tax=Candidatus Nitrospira nitrificans TaxID=1742973 RepID=A0A0S4LKQ2_9BACT|nr:YetF domain-containing protein [Candidatus Nitrospira nitrificans]CUS37486.1 conserved membrane hypothetical protein [Candidatus Nitrospira nitrificans]